MQAFLKVLSTGHTQKEVPNSYTKTELCNAYNALANQHNENCGPKAKQATPFTPEGLSYYLNNEGIDSFSECLLNKAINKDRVNTRAGEAHLASIRRYLPSIKGIKSQDGCYKHVCTSLADTFKGARTAAKPIENDDGTVTKAPNAQIGLQTTYCHVTESPYVIEISSGVASERDYMLLIKNEISIADAGLYSADSIKKANEIGAFVLYKGRSNMKGIILSMAINGASKTKKYKNADIYHPKVKSINHKSILDMQG